jgi:hypothetical protein
MCRTSPLTSERSDFRGATEAGMHGLLLRRTGPDGEQVNKEANECLNGIEAIENLEAVISLVRAKNGMHRDESIGY